MRGKYTGSIDIKRIAGSEYRNLKTAFYVLLIAWVTYLLLEAFTWENPESYTLPFLLALPFYILALILLLRLWNVLPLAITNDILERTTSQGGFGGTPSENIREEFESVTGTESGDSDHAEARSVVILFGWLAMFPVLLYLFGFIIGFPLYVFVFTFYLTRGVKPAILLAISVATVVQLLFIGLLNASVWDGIVFDMLGL